MTAIGIIGVLVLVWAFFPEIGAEWSKNFIRSRTKTWKKIFGCKEENTQD